MTNRARRAVSIFAIGLRIRSLAIGLAVSWAALALGVAPAQGQSFQVLHSFTGEGDDATPTAGLTSAGPGKFYGTTSGLNIGSDGSVFKLVSSGSGWVLQPLTNFRQPGDSGFQPKDKVTIGPDGNVYGGTSGGGRGECNDNGCGVVFKLQPHPSACASVLCQWGESALYAFGNPPDAGIPIGGGVFDHAGNIYGASQGGGTGCNGNGCGAVYKLSPSGGGWTETVIYSFQGGNDGKTPFGGLILDAAGNLYGTTSQGGSTGDGVVYELSPSNGGWTETILHTFQGTDGSFPVGSLIADQFGNLYGGAAGNLGTNATIFELSPPGNWNFQVLYTFSRASDGPWGTLTFDSSGNLYGASLGGGPTGNGYVFKLTPSNGSWTLTDLHDFQPADGVYPNAGLVFDSAGNLYGTAQQGGTFTETCYVGCGTIWEITP